MKFSNISLLVIIIASALGIALGDYFAQEIQSTGAGSNAVSANFPGLSPGSNLATDSQKSSQSGSETSEQAASSPKDLASIIHEVSSYHKMKDFTAFADSLSTEGILNALREFGTIIDNDRYEMADILIGRLAVSDPKAILVEAKKTQILWLKGALLNAAFGTMAAQNPSKAISQAQQLPDKDERRMALEGIIGQLAQYDPAQALALSQQMGNVALPGIFEQWAHKNPDEATKAALQLADDAQRSDALKSIGRQLGWQDSVSALAWLNQLPGPDRNGAQAAVVYAVAAHDPLTAAGYLTSIPVDQRDQQEGGAVGMLRDVSEIWSEIDPQADIAWLGSLPVGGDWHVAMMFAVNKWTYNDPKAALTGVNQLPEGEIRNYALGEALRTWGRTDPASAVAYALSMPEGDARQAAIESVVNFWSDNDPVSAAQWAAKLPDNSQKNDAYSSIAISWAKKDPTQAANWLSQLPAGSARDAAIRFFSYNIFDTDPDKAVQWAASIGDPKIQQAQLTNLLQQWMKKDPTNATTAVQNSSLPDDVKAQLLQTNH